MQPAQTARRPCKLKRPRLIFFFSVLPHVFDNQLPMRKERNLFTTLANMIIVPKPKSVNAKQRAARIP